ncbi:hypothetical protein CSPX01_02267 [Colletotrichum filicis]|nr:hypothetical protein CSPX01_02267 [Colletotrichum filicis]
MWMRISDPDSLIDYDDGACSLPADSVTRDIDDLVSTTRYGEPIRLGRRTFGEIVERKSSQHRRHLYFYDKDQGVGSTRHDELRNEYVRYMLESRKKINSGTEAAFGSDKITEQCETPRGLDQQVDAVGKLFPKATHSNGIRLF